jgi:ABC-type Na+ transport system ATPase subunit NatA
MIEVDHLHKRYGEVVAVDEVSFTVEDGEVFGVLGPNGAGKTTTVECIAGLRRRDGGAVRVGELDPASDRDAIRQLVGREWRHLRPVRAAEDVESVGHAGRKFLQMGDEPDHPRS